MTGESPLARLKEEADAQLIDFQIETEMIEFVLIF